MPSRILLIVPAIHLDLQGAETTCAGLKVTSLTLTASKFSTRKQELGTREPTKHAPLEYGERKEHRQLSKLAERAGRHAERNSKARMEFNELHIGRRSQNSYVNHKREADEALESADNFQVKAEEHERLLKGFRARR
ncbi:hypothetical protein ASPWEDRAFT_24133 [Aspergillus wentii DTO 134E9]|uniref:Uncharacterized protein n=1 Tax=Aspergillus wentii DTO 134E9 TaxID=1073089 RepID=A0A1L9RTB7_ASPWE|nr:uncharacterized protein ASPWEDRAFT_24133 [Aspergillus wentii DTO 134E9]OJJ38169.1 hypothetical protein ASPWEDRAFT_24133 [Aspergillus wentii DTO 134E9]